MARKQGGVTDGEQAIHEIHGNPAVDGEVSELQNKPAAPVAYRSYYGDGYADEFGIGGSKCAKM
jgi:hypothetical protein